MDEARRRVRPTTVVAIALFALLVASGAIAAFYTDALWFSDLGQSTVFWRTLAWSWGTGTTFGLVFFAVLYGNVRIARAMSGGRVLRPVSMSPLPIEVTLERVREAAGRVGNVAMLAASAVIAVLSGIAVAESWEVFALALSGGAFGAVDPQFGRDVGFYFFTLPALRFIQGWLTGTLVFTLLASAAVHVLHGSIRPWARWRGFDPHVKAHLSVIGGLIVVVQAFGYWLSIS